MTRPYRMQNKPVGSGFIHLRSNMQRTVFLSMDEEVVQEVRARAIEAQHSLQEELRQLVKIGLQNVHSDV